MGLRLDQLATCTCKTLDDEAPHTRLVVAGAPACVGLTVRAWRTVLVTPPLSFRLCESALALLFRGSGMPCRVVVV